jgi:TatA/E family protein of Tat protein translocase
MPFIGNLGPTELIIILVIALLVLGPGKLPEVGSALGKSIREFRKAAGDIKDSVNLDAPVAPAPAAPAAPAPVAPAAPAAPVAAAPAPAAPAAPAPDPTTPTTPPSGPEAPAA